MNTGITQSLEIGSDAQIDGSIISADVGSGIICGFTGRVGRMGGLIRMLHPLITHPSILLVLHMYASQYIHNTLCQVTLNCVVQNLYYAWNG